MQLAALLLALTLAAPGVCMVNERARLEQIARELRRREAVIADLFPAQRATLADQNRFKVVWTTRRAGKTTSAIHDWFYDAAANPFGQSVYIAITRSSAKRIAWTMLKQLNRTYGMGARFQEAELRVTLPNGATLQLFGADRPGLADRLLGTKLRRAYIDEAAFHNQDLTRLVDGVLLDAVSDERGHIWLLSTPGVLTRGLFYDLTRKLDWKDNFSGYRGIPCDTCPSAARWTVHRWTTFENPHMSRIWQAELDAAREINPNCENDPEYKRNRLGAWVHISGETVYQFNPEVNSYPDSVYEPRPGDNYALAMDYGWNDRQAFSLIAYRDGDHKVV